MLGVNVRLWRSTVGTIRPIGKLREFGSTEFEDVLRNERTQGRRRGSHPHEPTYEVGALLNRATPASRQSNGIRTHPSTVTESCAKPLHHRLHRTRTGRE